MLRKFFTSPKISPKRQTANLTENELVRRESQVGATLFGQIPPDRRRQFFCLDAATWIWYEEWTDENGSRRAVTTKYEIRGSVILKTQGQTHPEKLRGDELRNFAEAVRNYYFRVAAEVYHRPVNAS